MGAWLTELRRNLPQDIVLHVVGTKSDVVAREPSKREVPFERCIVSSFQSLHFDFTETSVPAYLRAVLLPRRVLWDCADCKTGHEQTTTWSALLRKGILHVFPI